MPIWESFIVTSVVAVLSAAGYCHSVAVAEEQSALEYMAQIERIREEKHEMILQRVQELTEKRLNNK
jgi:hypothetical protein